MHGSDHVHPHVWVTEGRVPQGGDFVRDVSRGFNIVSADPRVDQGDGFLYGSPFSVGNYISANKSPGANRDHFVAQLLKSIVGTRESYNFDIVTTASTVFAKVLASVSSSWTFQGVPGTVSSFWRMAQFNPGQWGRYPGWFSDLFVYDVVDSFTTINRRVVHFLEVLGVKLRHTGDIDSFGNLIQTDYYLTVSGSEDICIGDGEAPFITYIEPPGSGIALRPRDQTVEFSLVDEVGGVDLSSVSISLNSLTTTGTISLVDSGVDQTGGQVAIIGDPSGYLFLYDPPFLWDYNDKVTVTISGSDFPPQVGGNPFFCEGPFVNTFIGDLPFAVLNEEDIGATLTVVGDVDPPYISQAVPASGTTGNNVFAPVVIKVADDLTGVDLGTLTINIDSEDLVVNGVPQTSETVVSGDSSEYIVTYTPATAFVYDSTSTVTLSAYDRVETGPPNLLSSIYDFSFIEDSTLIIENLVPAVGTHHNLENLDIQVDVRDDSFGVDGAQTFFVINGTIVSGTQTPLASGIQMTYHPPNDFAFEEPIRVTVHATNANVSAPAVKEVFFNLFYGCRVFLFNEQPFIHAESVDVFIRARNLEVFHKDLSTGYFFSAYTQPSEDLGASIVAINPQADLPATLNGLGPEHRYGQTVTVEFSVEDFDGHLLGPYTFTYTIENKPD